MLKKWKKHNWREKRSAEASSTSIESHLREFQSHARENMKNKINWKKKLRNVSHEKFDLNLAFESITSMKNRQRGILISTKIHSKSSQNELWRMRLKMKREQFSRTNKLNTKYLIQLQVHFTYFGQCIAHWRKTEGAIIEFSADEWCESTFQSANANSRCRRNFCMKLMCDCVCVCDIADNAKDEIIFVARENIFAKINDICGKPCKIYKRNTNVKWKVVKLFFFPLCLGFSIKMKTEENAKWFSLSTNCVIAK